MTPPKRTSGSSRSLSRTSIAGRPARPEGRDRKGRMGRTTTFIPRPPPGDRLRKFQGSPPERSVIVSSPGVGMPRLAAFPKGFFDAIVERRMTVFEWIDHAATLELDGAELYPKFLDSFDSAYLKKVRAAASAKGLELPMFCNSPDFTQPDPADRTREVERTREMFRVTAELGGKYCRVLSGQNRPGLKEEEALKWVIDCLWRLEPHAKAAGVVMCMENHYKDGLWQYPEFAQSHRRYLTILDGVNSPWLKAQYDPSNAIVAGEDAYELLDRVMPRVATMQASDRYLDG